MSIGRLDNKGFGMIDAVMAVCITMIGIAGLLAIMPVGWSLAGSSDMRSRAIEIMQRNLDSTEMLIMNPCNTVSITTPAVIYSSGNSTPQPGDRSFTVVEAVNPAVTPSGNGWLITVRVLWSGTTSGVSEERLVTAQEDYRFPAGCADNSQNMAYTVY